MRILIFGLSSVRGGVESIILSFCRQALEKRLCNFDFVVIDKIPSYANFLSDEYSCSFIVVPSRARHPVRYRRGLKAALESKRYDFLWFNACTLSDITPLKVAKAHDVNCVLHSHNSKNMGNFMNKILHIIHKTRVHNYVDIYCACSDEAASFMFPKDIYSDQNKWSFIKNGISTKTFRFNFERRTTLRKEYGFDGDILVGHVGRLHPQKNHKFIINIFKEFNARYPSSKLLLFGEGPLEDELKKHICQKKLDSSVFFMGARDNIGAWLSALDIFLFPSLYEGLPVSLLEAQASGLPCLVSDVISPSAVCTKLVKKESLAKDASVWSCDLEKLLAGQSLSDRSLAWCFVEDAGFDVEREAVGFFESLKRLI